LPNRDAQERLARAIHADYVRRRAAEGSLAPDDPALRDWNELEESLKASNRDQAADIWRKLRAIECEAVPSAQAGGRAVELGPDEIETLAHLEHVRWVEDRLRQGWQPGPRRDVAARLSPYLVSWSELSEDVRDLDRDSVRLIPQLLADSGLSIVRFGNEEP
jgi:hypothetical protein